MFDIDYDFSLAASNAVLPVILSDSDCIGTLQCNYENQGTLLTPLLEKPPPPPR